MVSKIGRISNGDTFQKQQGKYGIGHSSNKGQKKNIWQKEKEALEVMV